MGGVTDVAVAMSTYSNYTGASAGMLSLHYTVPETIQPGQFRFLRVTWLTDPAGWAAVPAQREPTS